MEFVFRVVSEGGYYNSITDLTGDQIGEVFQNPMYLAADDDDSTASMNNSTSSSVRVGTN